MVHARSDRIYFFEDQPLPGRPQQIKQKRQNRPTGLIHKYHTYHNIMGVLLNLQPRTTSSLSPTSRGILWIPTFSSMKASSERKFQSIQIFHNVMSAEFSRIIDRICWSCAFFLTYHFCLGIFDQICWALIFFPPKLIVVGLGNLKCQYQEVSIVALIIGFKTFSFTCVVMYSKPLILKQVTELTWLCYELWMSVTDRLRKKYSLLCWCISRFGTV